MQTGKYQRHLDGVIPTSGFTECILVPAARHRKLRDRHTTNVTASMVQESLADEFRHTPNLVEELKRKEDQALKDEIKRLEQEQKVAEREMRERAKLVEKEKQQQLKEQERIIRET